MSSKELEALVAEVLDVYRLALNAGSSKGVSEGDDVVVWRLVDVKDPETQEILGTVRLDHVKLTVSFVDEKYSVASVRSPAPTFGMVSFFGARTKLASGRGGAGENTVVVRPGDEVTIYFADADQ